MLDVCIGGFGRVGILTSADAAEHVCLRKGEPVVATLEGCEEALRSHKRRYLNRCEAGELIVGRVSGWGCWDALAQPWVGAGSPSVGSAQARHRSRTCRTV